MLSRGRGRPKGAKNKPKRGRPKGSTKKVIQTSQQKSALYLEPNKAQHTQTAESESSLDSYLDDSKLLEQGFNLDTNKIINNDPINASFFYRGSKHVPIAGAQYEFTADMITEMKKCKDDIVYFAENYFFIVSLDRGKEKISLYEAQKRVLRTFVRERHAYCINHYSYVN